MFRYQAALYLPIVPDSLDAVLRTIGAPGSVHPALTVVECCALLGIESLGDAAMHSDPLGRAELRTSQAFELTRELPADDFVEAVFARLNADHLSVGAARLDALGIVLMTRDEVEARQFLTADGDWDFEFCSRHASALANNIVAMRASSPTMDSWFLSRDQDYVVRPLRADPDDHMEVSALAGTGKSFLTAVLLDQIKSGQDARQVLVLSQRRTQIDALAQRMGAVATYQTFGQLAWSLLCADFPHLTRRNEGVSMNFAQVAQVFDVPSVGTLRPVDVVRFARDTLRQWCDSNDPVIDEPHLPYFLRKDAGLGAHDVAPLTSADSAVMKVSIMAMATRLWEHTIDPDHAPLPLPVYGYHRIKFVSLHPALRVPNHYTHVFIDEAHDLTPAMVALLRRSPQACITLRDDYQTLGGTPAPPRADVRRRDMNRSVRAGTGLAEIVNPLIAVQPIAMTHHFDGNEAMRFDLRRYLRATVPTSPTAILTADEWGIWEWAQRLAGAGLPFTMLGGLAESQQDFVRSVLDLFHDGRPPRHRVFANLRTWDSLTNDLADHAAFGRIRVMLERGFSQKDWEATARFLKAVHIPGCYVLGRAEDARNHEFDEVMITPDVAEWVWRFKRRGHTVPRRVSSAIYVAATRARYVLSIPDALQNWLDEEAPGA